MRQTAVLFIVAVYRTATTARPHSRGDMDAIARQLAAPRHQPTQPSPAQPSPAQPSQVTARLALGWPGHSPGENWAVSRLSCAVLPCWVMPRYARHD